MYINRFFLNNKFIYAEYYWNPEYNFSYIFLFFADDLDVHDIDDEEEEEDEDDQISGEVVKP